MIQGTPEWHLARRGRITASRFREVVLGTPGQWFKMLSVIRAEAAMSEADFLACVGGSGASTRWGHTMEARARARYEFENDVRVEQVGLVVHPDNALIACSPDFLEDDDGGGEIKAPWREDEHRANVVHGYNAEKYQWQVHGSLWITQRARWAVISYDPRDKTGDGYDCRRVERDQSVIDTLAPRVLRFAEHLRNGTNPDIFNPRTDAVPQLF